MGFPELCLIGNRLFQPNILQLRLGLIDRFGAHTHSVVSISKLSTNQAPKQASSMLKAGGGSTPSERELPIVNNQF